MPSGASCDIEPGGAEVEGRRSRAGEQDLKEVAVPDGRLGVGPSGPPSEFCKVKPVMRVGPNQEKSKRVTSSEPWGRGCALAWSRIRLRTDSVFENARKEGYANGQDQAAGPASRSPAIAAIACARVVGELHRRLSSK